MAARKKSMSSSSKVCDCPHHKMGKSIFGWAILAWGLVWLLQELGYLASYINATPVFLVIVGAGLIMKGSCNCCEGEGHGW